MEVLVPSEDGRGSVLEAHGRDLCIEHEVAPHVRIVHQSSQERKEPAPRIEHSGTWAARDVIDGSHRLLAAGGPAEGPMRMRDDAEELTDDEDRETPGRFALGQLSQCLESSVMVR